MSGDLDRVPEALRGRVVVDGAGCWHPTTVSPTAPWEGHRYYLRRLLRHLVVGDVAPGRTDGLDVGPWCGDRACVAPAHQEARTRAVSVALAGRGALVVGGRCRSGDHVITGPGALKATGSGLECRACANRRRRQKRTAVRG